MDAELKTYLDGMEGRLVAKIHDGQVGFENRLVAKIQDVETRLVARMHDAQIDLENRMVEQMRDMQTELLRGFAGFSESQTLRLRKVEADQSNLDAALSGRVAIVEKRLHEIELRLGGAK